jgi:SAM-dependent methyltransferase
MKEVFDTYAENAFETTAGQEKIQWYLFNYKAFFPTDLNAKVLDIGIGLGEMLQTYEQMRYRNYIGIDISPSTVEYCKKLKLNCIHVDSSPEWLLNNKNSFELITLLDVIEHIPKVQIIDFLKACREALTDTGKIIIQTPNLQAVDGFLHRYNDITHEVGLIEHTMNQILKTSGFESYFNLPFEEKVEDDADTEKIRNIRAFYWKFRTAERNLAHNLTPNIMTPVFFSVAYKKERQMPISEQPHITANNAILNNVLMRSDTLSVDNLVYFCRRYGLKIEILEQILAMFSRVDDIDNRTCDLQINSDRNLLAIEVIKLEMRRYTLNEENELLKQELKCVRDILAEQSDLLSRIPKFLFRNKKH